MAKQPKPKSRQPKPKQGRPESAVSKALRAPGTAFAKGMSGLMKAGESLGNAAKPYYDKYMSKPKSGSKPKNNGR